MTAMTEVTAYIAIGANLGQAQRSVQQAMQALGQLPLTRLLACSSLYRTAPIASAALPLLQTSAPGPDYINAVAAIATGLTAPDLLLHLQALELAAGRERPYPDAPRTLDLDILLYGSARTNSAQLVIPHPRMAQRAFVLVPLAEIAPMLVSATQLAAVAQQVIEKLLPTTS
jgi:2-amino-4-hydroxy-6-hydroxymethyldihydropteridine diphosphokinase